MYVLVSYYKWYELYFSHWTFKNGIKLYFWENLWLIYEVRPEYSGFKTQCHVKASHFALSCMG